MGTSQSTMYVLLIRGDIETCVLGVFSTLEKAKSHAQQTCNTQRRMWIEKFCVDDPALYEDESEYVVWEST